MTSSPRTARPRPDVTATYFANLAARGHEPRLRRASGTVRLDLRSGEKVEHWYLTMVKGDISVSHRNAKADATVGMDKKLFEGMTRGTVNCTASLLRGLIAVEGALSLLSALDRLLPGPRRSLASFLERQQELA